MESSPHTFICNLLGIGAMRPIASIAKPLLKPVSHPLKIAPIAEFKYYFRRTTHCIHQKNEKQ